METNITPDTLETRTVTALKWEAVGHGDDRLADICEMWLGEMCADVIGGRNEAARRICRALNEARALDDSAAVAS